MRSSTGSTATMSRANLEPRSIFTPAYPPLMPPKTARWKRSKSCCWCAASRRALLFGADVNRNGQLDPHEMTEDGSGGSTDPASFRGWSAYLTLYSLEWNVNPEGKPRIYLNTMDLNKLYTDLSAVFPPEWVTFIIAYRQSGPANNSTVGQYGVSGSPDLTKQARTPIGQVLDLVGAKVNYRFAGSTESTLMMSPWENNLGSMNVTLPRLMDHVTVNPAMTIPGRININQAPAAILAGIPGMDADIVSQILTRRDVDISEKPHRRHESWLVQEGVVTLQEMKIMLPFVTGGGSVYRAQVVGYFQGGQAASRAEVVFDATRTMPRLLFWRDISHLGRGYALETLGVDYSETAAP